MLNFVFENDHLKVKCVTETGNKYDVVWDCQWATISLLEMSDKECSSSDTTSEIDDRDI